MDFITPRPPRVDWAALVAASTPYATAHVKLYTNDLTPSVDNVIGDFTEATFTGYAAAAASWNAGFIGAGGAVILPADLVTFLCSAGSGEIIYGYYLVGAGGEYLGAARLDNAPYPIAGPGYGLSVSPEVLI